MVKAEALRERAKAESERKRGVRFVRKRKLSAFQLAGALARLRAGQAVTDIGRSYGVSHSTISRL